MDQDLATNLTDSIDEISRLWVESLRRNSRTEIHKQLLTIEIIDGVKGMLGNVALALSTEDLPIDDAPLPPLTTGNLSLPEPSTEQPDQRISGSLPQPLKQATSSAVALGKLRHKQGYEMHEVVYEFIKLRQTIWRTLAKRLGEGTQASLEAVARLDRVMDELALTTMESYYNSNVRDLERRAMRDPLTQLYNTHSFRNRLNEELRRAVRYSSSLSVVMIDLDKLKSINDTYGHLAGNEAIKGVAAAIRDNCRQSDVPCRYGGDEFAVILPETTKQQARVYAERVGKAVRALTLMIPPADAPDAADALNKEMPELKNEPGDQSAVVLPSPTISIGIASFPDDARNPETLLSQADAALYKSKNEGRDRISG